MKLLLTGTSGMIGNHILKKSLVDKQVMEVVSIGRKILDIKNPKLKQIVCNDFTNFDGLEQAFKDVDGAHFCIGVYTGAVPDEKFKEITVDYAAAFGKKLKEQSPNATLCFLSGQGADQNEKSKTAFARYKGMAENILISLDLGGLFIFRPSYIYPVEKRKEPNAMYKVSRILYPLIKLFGKNWSIKSSQLAESMYNAVKSKPNKKVLENSDILDLLP